MDPRPVARRSAPLDIDIDVPGSKSVANRALICAALADGESQLTNVPGGDDTEAMLDCLDALGFGVERPDPRAATRPVRVGGGLARMTTAAVSLPARLAGTTSRFITALAAIGPGRATVDGAPPLRARPMGPLHDALAQLGASVVPVETAGHLPVTITGPLTARRAVIELPGDVSSQFLTALMLIGPYLPDGLTLHLSTPPVSRPYLTMTAAVMTQFGVTDVDVGEVHVHIRPGRYVPVDLAIEPDASSASYPLAAAAVCGGRVRVNDLRAGSVQGDAVFADLLGRMGAVVERDAVGTTVRCRDRLIGIDVDMADYSDLVPTLAVVAAGASSATTIAGVGFIRAKESDRIGDLCHELRRAGVRATELADGLRIDPGGTPTPATLDTHHDHRLAMAFAVLGLGRDGLAVRDPGVVAKSWPQFWERWDELSRSSNRVSPDVGS